MDMLALVLSIAIQTPGHIHCPIGDQIVDDGGYAMEYKGIRYATCCDHCGKLFQSHPDRSSLRAAGSDTIGVSFFDPVDGLRVDAAHAEAFAELKGVRYYFHSTSNKSAFEKSPDRFSAYPKTESLVCPVKGDVIKRYHESAGYVDFEGSRYYACCTSCLKLLKANPAKYVASVQANLRSPIVQMP
jgi:YHS domain-containing protein